PANASAVGRMVNEFTAYFRSGGVYKFHVNWAAVRRDHPELLGSGPPEPATRRPVVEDMITALEDEVRAIRNDMEQHPVRALGAAGLGMAAEGSFLYESPIDLPGDAELPIPEGVAIKLVWPPFVQPAVMDATLLSYDSLSARVVFEVEQPLSRRHLE